MGDSSFLSEAMDAQDDPSWPIPEDAAPEVAAWGVAIALLVRRRACTPCTMDHGGVTLSDFTM